MSDFSSKYDVYEQLGEGSYGTVMRCVKKRTGQQYAVKIMKRGMTEQTFAVTNFDFIFNFFRKILNQNNNNRLSCTKQNYSVNYDIQA